MRTRKTLAGVTAGALALGVLALSPISPASAGIVSSDAPTPGEPGSTMVYVKGSLAGIPVPDAVDDDSGYVAAKITTSSNISVFGLHRVSSQYSDGFNFNFSSFPANAAGGPYWETVTSTGASVAIDYAMRNLDGGPLDAAAPLGENLFIKSQAGSTNTTTVQFWEDVDADGVIDVSEESSAQDPITVKFIDPADVFVYTVTSPSSPVNVGRLVYFVAIPLVGTDPLLQDVDGPISWQFASNTSASGLSDWSTGSFASLNGNPATAATIPAPPLDALGIYTGAIYAANTGTINATGWFDKTGATPYNATAAPLSPPAGFKVGTASVQVVNQIVSDLSTITASGTGLVEENNGYVAPLTTKNVTFTVTALREDPNNPDEALPIANQKVQIYVDAECYNNETFTVNGAASDLDEAVFDVTTDANGVGTLTLTVDRAPESTITSCLDIFVGLLGAYGEDFYSSTTYVRWDAPGIPSGPRSTVTVNNRAVDGDFVESRVSNAPTTVTVTLRDTFGNPLPYTEVYTYDNCDDWGTDADTNASGQVTLTIPGRIDGYRCIYIGVSDWFDLAYGDIYYKPQAQMTAGKITTQPRHREWVSQGDGFPNDWHQVTFFVTDSTGDPMEDVVADFSTSRGILSDDPWDGPESDYADFGNTAHAPVDEHGDVSVWVASNTTGTADVTISIGGKTATAKVDFTNRYAGASTLVLTAKDGSEVPTSVAPKAKVRMRAAATDSNGNPLEGAYVIVKVKGDARTNTGNRQIIRFTGKNGSFSFYVKARDAGSFRVIAKTDKAIDDETFTPAGYYVEEYIKAKTPTILIED